LELSGLEGMDLLSATMLARFCEKWPEKYGVSVVLANASISVLEVLRAGGYDVGEVWPTKEEALSACFDDVHIFTCPAVRGG